MLFKKFQKYEESQSYFSIDMDLGLLDFSLFNGIKNFAKLGSFFLLWKEYSLVSQEKI